MMGLEDPHFPEGRSQALRLLKQRLTWTPSIPRLCTGFAKSTTRPSSDEEDAFEEGTGCDWESECPLLPGNTEIRRKLVETLSATVEHGVNASVLLIGPRGLGKSVVLHSALQQLFSQKLKGSGAVLPLYLNARLFPEDSQALQALTAGLTPPTSCPSQEDGDAGEGGSDALEEATAATDFRSHLVRHCRGSTEGVPREHDGGSQGRSVVVVLDEMHLFAARPRQTLLYSVFDALQSPAVRLAVVGLTCRLDVEELLEKRVRSRHSGCKLVFAPPQPADLVQLARESLLLPLECPRRSGAHAHGGNPGSASAQRQWRQFAGRFNESVEQLLSDHSRPPAPLASHTALDLTPSSLFRLLFRAVCVLDGREGSELRLSDLEAALLQASEASQILDLQGLSVLELYLLVSMRRLELKDRDSYNFVMVFEEYRSCVSLGSSDIYSPEVARQAFQRLQVQGLVTAARGGAPPGAASRDLPEYALVQSCVPPRELEQALRNHRHCPAKLKVWLSREIHQQNGHAAF